MSGMLFPRTFSVIKGSCYIEYRLVYLKGATPNGVKEGAEDGVVEEGERNFR